MKTLSAHVPVLAVILFGVVQTGCAADECEFPGGSYRPTIKEYSGTCPEAEVRAVFDDPQTKAYPKQQCWVETKSSVDQIDGCSISASVSRVYSESGLTGTGSFAMTCSDGSSCNAAVKIVYVK